MSLHAALLVQQAGAGSIEVKVIRATNVPRYRADILSHNDMYVTLSKGTDKSGDGGIECGRTSIKKDTAEPTWNEVLRCDSCDSNTRIAIALREDGGLFHGQAHGGFTFTNPIPASQKTGPWSLVGGGLLHYEFDSGSDFCGTQMNSAESGAAAVVIIVVIVVVIVLCVVFGCCCCKHQQQQRQQQQPQPVQAVQMTSCTPSASYVVAQPPPQVVVAAQPSYVVAQPPPQQVVVAAQPTTTTSVTLAMP